MSSVLLRNSVYSQVDLVFVRLLSPFLHNVGSVHVDGFVFFWLSQLFDRFPLHEEDTFGAMHISAALELYWFSRDLSRLPINLRVEIV